MTMTKDFILRPTAFPLNGEEAWEIIPHLEETILNYSNRLEPNIVSMMAWLSTKQLLSGITLPLRHLPFSRRTVSLALIPTCAMACIWRRERRWVSVVK